MQFHPCFQFPGSPQEPWGGRRAGGEGHLRAPRGLGGWGAVVAEHEHEGAGEVVGQGAAAVLVAHREQEEQQQKQEQQQLQGKSHAAQPPAQGAASASRPHLLESSRLPWRTLGQEVAGVLEFGLVEHPSVTQILQLIRGPPCWPETKEALEEVLTFRYPSL